MSKSQLLPKTLLLEVDSFYLKREDLNPSGSVKDRAVVVQLTWARKNGYKQVAASTSGNFGLSLGYWAKHFGLKVMVFISPQTNPNKVKKLKSLSLELKVSKKPISDCFLYCKKTGALNVRQSKDPRALVGFSDLGKEIGKQIKESNLETKSIFFPVSSGTTLLGVAQGLVKEGISLAPFVVQPANHPVLAKTWDQKYQPEERIVADALVAKVLPKKTEILRLIKNQKGGGVVVQNESILSWADWLNDRGISTSYEGALGLAGVEKAKKLGLIKDGDKPICLLTGRKY